MEKTERHNGIELLRIISIIGIICMHTFGAIYTVAEGHALIFGVFINSLFNIGVTCFALISGYFGIRRDFKKIINLELMVLFYSIGGGIASFN